MTISEIAAEIHLATAQMDWDSLWPKGFEGFFVKGNKTEHDTVCECVCEWVNNWM